MAANCYVENIPSEMLSKLLGPEFTNIQIKDLILNEYGSIDALKKQARQSGQWKAKADLSLAYKEGIPELDVEKDLDKELGWLEASIDNGNPFPIDKFSLGTLYDSKGTISCQRKAHELYHEAARFGLVRAELNLAETYRCGIEGVVDEDIEEAFKWYRRAVDEETPDLESLQDAAQMMRGTVRKMDVDAKLKALSSLHKNYLSGDCPEGKPQQLKAMYYLKKAAELGHTESQFELGLTYLKGMSEIPKDSNEAKRWLGKAANNGNKEAKEILENFNQQGIIETVAAPKTNRNEQDMKGIFQQFTDIFKGQLEQSKNHPFLVENPMIYHESMFTRFPESPTAQRYLKAFQLARDGLCKLQEGNFKEAAKPMAHSYLYENTMLTSFPQTKTIGFRQKVIQMVFKELKVNNKFFEGLILLIALPLDVPVESSEINFGSFKLDSKKEMFLKNLIHLIESNDEPSTSGNENSFEESYKSWLHVLYFFLGSQYTIADKYDKGAQAFEKSIQCCQANQKPLQYYPLYFEAKTGFGYCLMNIYMEKKSKEEKVFSLEEKETESDVFVQMYQELFLKNIRVPENSYERWEATDLGKKAKDIFIEYLNEAPVCDNKYPNCHYHLAYLYFLEGDFHKACEWKARGEDAAEKRLPFMRETHINSKDLLDCLDMLPIPKGKKCANKECTNKVEKLLNCPCKQVSYCGSVCQKKDRKEHKKICSSKPHKKTK